MVTIAMNMVYEYDLFVHVFLIEVTTLSPGGTLLNKDDGAVPTDTLHQRAISDIFLTKKWSLGGRSDPNKGVIRCEIAQNLDN